VEKCTAISLLQWGVVDPYGQTDGYMRACSIAFVHLVNQSPCDSMTNWASGGKIRLTNCLLHPL